MYQIALVTVSVLAISGAYEVPHLDGRIIGGKNVTIEEFPYQVSLQYLGNHMCGGSLISTNFVLTAGHCIITVSPEVYTIRAGSSVYFDGGELVSVQKVMVHPLFSRSTLDHDVAVLKLRQNLKLSYNIQTIQLQHVGVEPRDGDLAIVSGWGTLQEGGQISSMLQAVGLIIKSRQECNILNGNTITEQMICASNVGKDSCQGDSGGPLVSKGKQIGIVSWGYGCARPFYPGVYTNVQKIVEFVKSARESM